MNMGKALLAGILVILLVAVGYFVYRDYLAPVPETPVPTETPSAQVEQPSETVSSEGSVEPVRYVNLGFAGSGQVAEVLVQEGDRVSAGDRLVVLESSSLEAAARQAEAALQSAQANLQSAQTRQEQAVAAARAADAAAGTGTGSWNADLPTEVEQPSWYFTHTEEISATQTEVDSAWEQLRIAENDLQMVLDRATSADLAAVEKRLAEAQAAFLVADDVLNQAQDSGDSDLRERAQEAYDSALSELNAAQDSYDETLDTQAAEDVIEARSRVAVARERYESARDRLDSLMSGEDSLEVRLAQEDIDRAQAGDAEAEAALASAQAALEQAVLTAPFDGTVTQMEVEPNEVVTPASSVITLANLDEWIVRTDDLAEADIALLQVGMPASVSLDAFPGETFNGTVRSIALWSADTRGTVTYEVTVSFDPRAMPLRWGMTAFVEIDASRQ